jgi:hypothetical protein
MARKKKRGCDMDDPADIFGGERALDKNQLDNDRAYDAFRRHIEEHIHGETRAFHELRSTAEHELQAAVIVTSTPRWVAQPKKNQPPEPTPMKSMPASKTMPPPTPMSRPKGVGTMIALGLIFTAIGFLMNSALHQMQPTARKASGSAKARLVNDANCAREKAANSKKATVTAPKNTAVNHVVPVLEDNPPLAAVPARVLPVEADSTLESTRKGMTLRAVELRKGPGSSFEIVDSLPPGFALDGVLTTDRQWLRVKPGAFVSVDAVQFQDSLAAGFQTHWVGPQVANIREFPLITSRIIRKAEPTSEVKLQIFNGEWAQVLGGGFVFRKLVTNEAPRLLQLPAVMRVTVEKAEIRGGPGQHYPVLGLYFRNHKLEVQEAQGVWLRVGPDQFIRAQEMELSVKPQSDKTM